MKRICALALLAAGCAAPPLGTDRPSAQATDEAGQPATAAVAQGNAAFGVSLYKRLAGQPGNLFISPISIAGAFGPVIAGAEGETANAIAATLRFPAAGPALHPALGGLLRNLKRTQEGATLSIANALWVQQGFALKPAFAATARQAYDAEVDTLDFARAPDAAAARINGWVNEETRGRIPELIAASSLNQDTALVVTNAVYFLGDWVTPFNESNTADQPFHLPGGATKSVPLMYRKDPFRYFETESFQAIDLSYKDERLAMSIFLPKARDGLGAFERSLSDERLGEWLRRLDAEQPRDVRLYLPKLKIEEKYDLAPTLGTMGMEIAFTPSRANFRGIADADLFISQVIHKSFLRIDEKGTEAAAATGIEIEVTGAPAVPPPVFRADHPFFLVIREKASGAVLFMGRIASPEPV